MIGLLIAATLGGSPDLYIHNTGSMQQLFIRPEELKYKTTRTAWSNNGCFCAMCVGNGTSGWRTSSVCVNAPSPIPDAESILRSVGLSARDVFCDAGCGDGRLVVLAAKEFGADSVGVDRRGEAIELAESNARRNGVEGLTKFIEWDALKIDYSRVSVIYAYLPPDVIRRLGRDLGQYPGLRMAISYKHAWESPDNQLLGDFHVWPFQQRLQRKMEADKGGKQYVLRVWSADWCGVCKSDKWKQAIERFDDLPGMGIQRLDFDAYREHCEGVLGITSLPHVQLFEGSGDTARMIGQRSGAVTFSQLEAMLNGESRANTTQVASRKVRR